MSLADFLPHCSARVHNTLFPVKHSRAAHLFPLSHCSTSSQTSWNGSMRVRHGRGPAACLRCVERTSPSRHAVERLSTNRLRSWLISAAFAVHLTTSQVSLGLADSTRQPRIVSLAQSVAPHRVQIAMPVQ